MIPIVFDVTITGDGFTNKKALKKHMRVGLQIMLLLWMKNFYDRHFQTSAYARYPGVYAQRLSDDPEKALAQIKRRLKRDIRPNVKTGRMRRALKSSFRIQGTSTVATLTMMGPPYTDIQRNNQPDKVAEITAMTGGEKLAMRKAFRNFLVRAINDDRSVRRIRIGGA